MSVLHGDTPGERFHNDVLWRGIGGTTPSLPTNLRQLEALAQQRLSAKAFGYLNGGAGTGATVQANRDAFAVRRLVPSVMRDVSVRDHSVTVCGQEIAVPMVVSPMGALSLAHDDSDLAVARAAATRGVPVVLSPMADTRLEEIANELPEGQVWLELLWHRDDAVLESILARARSAGVRVLVLGLDLPVLGWRPPALDHAYLPFLHGRGATNITADPAFTSTVDTSNAQELAAGWAALSSDPSRTWESVRRLRSRWDGPLIVKGIQTPQDAKAAVRAGVDGVWVSNHGGRQVDGAAATLDLLPRVVDAVGECGPVLLDGGIRTAADIVKALAVGATAAGLGRVVMWGLALAGEHGVRHVLDCLIAELDATLANLGVDRASQTRGRHLLDA